MSTRKPEPKAHSEPDATDVAHLLPPKFQTVTSGLGSEQASDTPGRIVLPSSDGGVVSVDANTVRIVEDGESIELKILPAAKKRQRRALRNTLAILIGLAILGVAFFVLT